MRQPILVLRHPDHQLKSFHQNQNKSIKQQTGKVIKVNFILSYPPFLSENDSLLISNLYMILLFPFPSYPVSTRAFSVEGLFIFQLEKFFLATRKKDFKLIYLQKKKKKKKDPTHCISK